MPEKIDTNKESIITDKAELERLLKQQGDDKQAGDKPDDEDKFVDVDPMCYDMGPPLE